MQMTETDVVTSQSPKVEATTPRRDLRVRLVVWTFLVLCMVAVAVVVFFIYYRPRPTIIELAGTPTEMGAQYGRETKLEMGLLVDWYLRKVVCMNNADMFSAATTTALTVTDRLPDCYAQELSAMSETTGIDRGAIAYGNAFLDLGAVPAGCRTVVVVTDNRTLHAHNMDWDNIAGLARWTTTIVRRSPADDRLDTVTVCFPGMIGAIDIINEKGLALSFNQGGGAPAKEQTTELVFVRMRRIAETCTSFAEAEEMILQTPSGMPFIITLSAAATGEATVYERGRDGVRKREGAGGLVCAMNVTQFGGTKRTALDNVLAEREEVVGVEGMKTVLRHPQILVTANIYSVIFDFRNNRMYLASGSIPAAADEYREFDLF